MKHQVNRRDFLKAVPAASALAYAGTRASAEQPSAKAGQRADRIGARTARCRTIRFSRSATRRSRSRTRFWKPKVEANAKVTIPFEVRS